MLRAIISRASCILGKTNARCSKCGSNGMFLQYLNQQIVNNGADWNFLRPVPTYAIQKGAFLGGNNFLSERELHRKGQKSPKSKNEPFTDQDMALEQYKSIDFCRQHKEE